MKKFKHFYFFYFLYMRIKFTNIGKNTRLYSLQVDNSIPGEPQNIYIKKKIRTKKAKQDTAYKKQKLREKPVRQKGLSLGE